MSSGRSAGGWRANETIRTHVTVNGERIQLFQSSDPTTNRVPGSEGQRTGESRSDPTSIRMAPRSRRGQQPTNTVSTAVQPRQGHVSRGRSLRRATSNEGRNGNASVLSDHTDIGRYIRRGGAQDDNDDDLFPGDPANAPEQHGGPAQQHQVEVREPPNRRGGRIVPGGRPRVPSTIDEESESLLVYQPQVQGHRAHGAGNRVDVATATQLRVPDHRGLPTGEQVSRIHASSRTRNANSKATAKDSKHTHQPVDGGIEIHRGKVRIVNRMGYEFVKLGDGRPALLRPASRK